MNNKGNVKRDEVRVVHFFKVTCMFPVPIGEGIYSDPKGTNMVDNLYVHSFVIENKGT